MNAGGGPGTTLGQRIKSARKALGLTQAALGSPTLSASYISMIEHDRVRPSLATLRLLAERLRQPPAAFLDAPPSPAEQARLVVRRGESLLRQHRFTDALEAFQDGVALTGDAGHLEWQVRAELGLGQALAGLRHFDLAERHLSAARALAEAASDADLSAAAANALGFLAFRARQYSRARQIFQAGIEGLRRAGHSDGETLGKLLSNLGRVYVELGLPAQALQVLQEAESLLGRAADPAHRALLLFNLGVASERQGAFAEAEEYLARAEALLRLHENLRLLGMVKRSIGMLRLSQGRLDDADRELSESLHLARQCADDEGAAQTLVEVAHLRAAQGSPDLARTAAAEAEGIARRIHDEAEAARAAAADGAALAVAGHRSEAAARFREAIEMMARLGMAGDLAAACRDLGYVYRTLGQHEAAATQFARAFDLLREAPSPSVR